MTPLMGAGLAIVLLCGLLVFRIPMIVALMAVVFFSNFTSGAWMLTLPQTMMSGIGHCFDRFRPSKAARTRKIPG